MIACFRDVRIDGRQDDVLSGGEDHMRRLVRWKDRTSQA